jgi:hypothetical protein
MDVLWGILVLVIMYIVFPVAIIGATLVALSPERRRGMSRSVRASGAQSSETTTAERSS